LGEKVKRGKKYLDLYFTRLLNVTLVTPIQRMEILVEGIPGNDMEEINVRYNYKN